MPSPPATYSNLPSSADLFYLCTTLSDTELDTRLGPPSAPYLKVGVLLFGQRTVQLIDLAPIDILAMLSRERAERLDAPPNVLEETIALEIHFISESGNESVRLTSGAMVPITNSFDDTPHLDVLILPDSHSMQKLPDSATAFLATQLSSPNITSVMCISSGIIPLAQVNLLNHKQVTASPNLLSALQGQFPNAEWTETRWARDGRLWTSNSPLAAVEMMATWMREHFWDRIEAVEWALGAAGLYRVSEDED